MKFVNGIDDFLSLSKFLEVDETPDTNTTCEPFFSIEIGNELIVIMFSVNVRVEVGNRLGGGFGIELDISTAL